MKYLIQTDIFMYVYLHKGMQVSVFGVCSVFVCVCVCAICIVLMCALVIR